MLNFNCILSPVRSLRNDDQSAAVRQEGRTCKAALRQQE